MEHSYIGNAVPGIVMAALAKRPARVVWAGDYADEEPDGTIIYSLANKLPEPEVGPQEYRYLVNLDRGVFVDLEAVGDDGEGYKIHPLPLLTAEGNGRGGGDFRGENVHLGTWAREQLAATDVYPNGLDELVPDFQES